MAARGLAIDCRFLNPFRMCLVAKWLQTHPESTGKSSYSCGILALVPREHVYEKYLCPTNHFGIPRNCAGENTKSIQTPVPLIIFCPPARRNPDWLITMTVMQLTTQFIHYHIFICIIICYKPKGNIIILLSSLELKAIVSQ